MFFSRAVSLRAAQPMRLPMLTSFSGPDLFKASVSIPVILVNACAIMSLGNCAP